MFWKPFKNCFLVGQASQWDTDEEAKKSHDKAFKALLDCCREKGIKLNKAKLKYKMPSVAYMGHVLSAGGLSPDPEKVKAINDVPRPIDVPGVQRLLGVANYLSKFAPQLSTVDLCKYCHIALTLHWISSMEHLILFGSLLESMCCMWLLCQVGILGSPLCCPLVAGLPLFRSMVFFIPVCSAYCVYTITRLFCHCLCLFFYHM